MLEGPLPTINASALVETFIYRVNHKHGARSTNSRLGADGPTDALVLRLATPRPPPGNRT
jgi:hypothetical protein